MAKRREREYRDLRELYKLKNKHAKVAQMPPRTLTVAPTNASTPSSSAPANPTASNSNAQEPPQLPVPAQAPTNALVAEAGRTSPGAPTAPSSSDMSENNEDQTAQRRHKKLRHVIGTMQNDLDRHR